MELLEEVVEEGVDKDVLLLDIPSNVDAVDVSADSLDVLLDHIKLPSALRIHGTKTVLGIGIRIDLHIPGEDGRRIAPDGLQFRIGRMRDLDLGVIGQIDHETLVKGNVSKLHTGNDNINCGIANLLKRRMDRNTIRSRVEGSVLIKQTHKPHALGILSLADLASIRSSLENECIGIIHIKNRAETIKQMRGILDLSKDRLEIGVVVSVFIVEGLLEELAKGLLATPPGVVGVELPEGREEPPVVGVEETDDGSLDSRDCIELAVVKGELGADDVLVLLGVFLGVSKHARNDLVTVKNHAPALLDRLGAVIVAVRIRPELEPSLDISIEETNIRVVANSIHVHRHISGHCFDYKRSLRLYNQFYKENLRCF